MQNAPCGQLDSALIWVSCCRAASPSAAGEARELGIMPEKSSQIKQLEPSASGSGRPGRGGRPSCRRLERPFALRLGQRGELADPLVEPWKIAALGSEQ